MPEDIRKQLGNYKSVGSGTKAYKLLEDLCKVTDAWVYYCCSRLEYFYENEREAQAFIDYCMMCGLLVER